MFWNFHFVICIYFKFLQIFFYAFVNVISFNGNMVRLRFPVKIENKKKKRENKLQITKNYNDISNASKIETIDRKTKKKRQKKKKLLHESDRFKEEEEKRRAR